MTETPRKSAPKTRGKPFEVGNSGKPLGARHRITLLAEKLMADDAENVVNAVLLAAREGDMTAARLVLDRLAPVRKGRAVTLPLPAVNTAADVLTALGITVREMATGSITPDEAATVAGVIEVKRRAIETTEFESRIKILEERTAGHVARK